MSTTTSPARRPSLRASLTPVFDSAEQLSPTEYDDADDESIRRSNQKLQSALKDSDDRAMRLESQHQRELAQLRAELERSASDRQQLERMVEEAQAGRMEAQSSLASAQPLSAELEELRRRLAAEADATRRLQEECERVKAKCDAAEAEAAAERERAKEARSEAETLKLQVQHVATTKEDDVAKLRSELAEAQRLMREAQKELGETQAELDIARATARPAITQQRTGPPIPGLNFGAGGSVSNFATPRGPLQATPRDTSFTHFTVQESARKGPKRHPRWRGDYSATVTPRVEIPRPTQVPDELASQSPLPEASSPLVPQNDEARFDDAAAPDSAAGTPTHEVSHEVSHEGYQYDEHDGGAEEGEGAEMHEAPMMFDAAAQTSLENVPVAEKAAVAPRAAEDAAASPTQRPTLRHRGIDWLAFTFELGLGFGLGLETARGMWRR